MATAHRATRRPCSRDGHFLSELVGDTGGKIRQVFKQASKPPRSQQAKVAELVEAFAEHSKSGLTPGPRPACFAFFSCPKPAAVGVAASAPRFLFLARGGTPEA